MHDDDAVSSHAFARRETKVSASLTQEGAQGESCTNVECLAHVERPCALKQPRTRRRLGLVIHPTVNPDASVEPRCALQHGARTLCWKTTLVLVERYQSSLLLVIEMLARHVVRVKCVQGDANQCARDLLNAPCARVIAVDEITRDRVEVGFWARGSNSSSRSATARVLTVVVCDCIGNDRNHFVKVKFSRAASPRAPIDSRCCAR